MPQRAGSDQCRLVLKRDIVLRRLQLEDVLETGPFLRAGPVVHALTEECDQVTALLAPYANVGPSEVRPMSDRRDHASPSG